ncbi:MAG TPA: 3-phosphoglycerate dehydrogenase family protein [Spirochaetota bacterium]|nr:3-phosphoglycerate dehydrogenase family protein [Spirochaetota bacterium]
MYKIKTYNKIARRGLDLFESKNFKVDDNESAPDAIVLRSYKLQPADLPDNLIAIGRAGAGVNNIPVSECTKRGICVFNTPGANANAVKELVIAGLLLGSRKIVQGIQALEGVEDKSDIAKAAEKIKKQFAGPEIKGKTIGIIGLGAIGVLVAEAASDLGMKVIGYDPYLSVENAWRIPNHVSQAADLDEMLPRLDYLSLHIPVVDTTRNFINTGLLSKMKDGVRIVNFARGGLVNADDLAEALNTGKAAAYVTDFADAKLMENKNVVCIPHLGASTPEAENNCATMACSQIKDYLLNGNIVNSVNFPDTSVGVKKEGESRLTIIHKNKPKMLGAFTDAIGDEDLNISDLSNNSRDETAYTLIDVNVEPSAVLIEKLQHIEGVFGLRVV